MKEIWKDIKGYEGLYQVSNKGQVRSILLNRVLKATPDNRKLCRVSLRNGGFIYKKYIHQIVAETFLEKKDGCNIVAHKDGNSTNNRLDNLYWMDCVWNVKEPLKDEEVAEVMDMYSKGISLSDIARKKQFDITKVYCATKGFALIPKEFKETFQTVQNEVSFSGDKFRLSSLLHDSAYVSDKGIVIKINSKNKKHPKVLKTTINRDGYEVLNFALSGEIKEFHSIHRIVAYAFIPRIDGKLFVNHKDGDKRNNCANNLEWCTKSENTIHAFATGLKKAASGENHGCAKLTNKEVIEIRELLREGKTGVFISKKYGISANVVSKIKTNKLWKTG